MSSPTNTESPNPPLHAVLRKPLGSDLVILPIVFVAGVLVCLARSPSTILHPELFAEDGTVWFANAYTRGWWVPLTQTHSGYLQTFSRLTADVGLLVPLRRLPLLFVGVSLVVQVLPAVVLASRRYERLVPRFWVRALLAGAYLLASNTSEINVNLTDSQWHLGLLAVIVVLATPATDLWRVFDVVVIVVSGLTGPFGVVLVPILLVLFLLRRERWLLVLLILSAVTSVIQLLELLTSPRDQLGPLGMTVPRLVEILGGQVVGGTFLGSSTLASTSVHSHFFRNSSLLLVMGVIIVGFAVLRGPLELKLFNGFAIVVLVASLASPVATTTGSQWQALAEIGGARYWFFPSLALLVDLFWLVGQRRLLRGGVAIAACILIASLAVFGVREDFRYPVLPKPNWAAQVARFESLSQGEKFTFVIDPPGWNMVLVKK